MPGFWAGVTEILTDDKHGQSRSGCARRRHRRASVSAAYRGARTQQKPAARRACRRRIHRPHSHRAPPPADAALEARVFQAPVLPAAAMRTAKALRPAQLDQIVAAGRLGREALRELRGGAQIFLHPASILAVSRSLSQVDSRFQGARTRAQQPLRRRIGPTLMEGPFLLAFAASKAVWPGTSQAGKSSFRPPFRCALSRTSLLVG